MRNTHGATTYDHGDLRDPRSGRRSLLDAGALPPHVDDEGDAPVAVLSRDNAEAADSGDGGGGGDGERER